MRSTPDATPYAADTPAGLFTAAGTWYRTRAADLAAFVAPAASEEEIPDLLRASDRLIGAPRTLALWMLPVALVVMPWPEAVALTLAAYVALTLLLPAVAFPGLARVLRLLDPPIGQMLAYVFVLSLLAARGAHPAVWAGLAGFVVLRWNLLAPLVRPLADRLYAPSLADRVLRALLVRTATQRGVTMPEIEKMEKTLLTHLRRR